MTALTDRRAVRLELQPDVVGIHFNLPGWTGKRVEYNRLTGRISGNREAKPHAPGLIDEVT